MNNKTAPKISKKQERITTTETTHAQELTPKDIIKFSIFRHRREQPVHWKNSKELNRVMHHFPGTFRATLLELLDRSMSRHEIRDFLNRMGIG
jgi:hypothetical protein